MGSANAGGRSPERSEPIPCGVPLSLKPSLASSGSFLLVDFWMKKDVSLTVRIDEEMYAAVKKLAAKDERTVRWMFRKLAEEALVARKALRKRKPEI